jgi:hypothetical protein
MVLVISLDDLGAMSLSVAFSLYWPMLVGALVLFLLLMNGHHRLTIPVVGIFMLVQAWHSGAFG